MNEEISQYLSGDLGTEERMDLIWRIENDDQLRDKFVQIQNLNALSELLPHASDPSEGIKHFEALMKKIRQRNQRKFIVNFAKYAAIALIVIISTVWMTLFLTDSDNQSTINKLHVPAGQRAQITLQDGTEVWLNAQSTLEYPSRFSRKNRKVKITGEAFFSVAQDKKRPFIVSVRHIDMEVLGTQFNVYNYPNADYIQTNLLEGSLRVYPASDKKNNIVLQPNEQVTIAGDEMIVEKIDNPEHMLWKDGIYAFNNERLIDIIEKLELYYDVKIVVEDPDIFNVRYTGKFRQRDGIDEILHILQKIQAFTIEKDREKNIITLTK